MSCSTNASRSAGVRVAHHHERESNRVGEERLVLGIDPALGADDRFGNVHLERLLAPLLTGS